MPIHESCITIANNLDGLEEAVDKILEGEGKLVDDIKEYLLFARIRHDYRIERKRRKWGEATDIKEELAVKYLNNPERIRYINDILYRKY